MSPISQIRLHQGDHLPSGSDALPWYGTPVAASGVPGIATVGTLADMPAATAGTQSGSDGAAAGMGFTSTSGLFTAANTGDTIAITDVGVTPAVVYSFTVTYSSQTALTLSGPWTGTATADLPWVLSGSGPSNQGLWYFATDDTTAPTTGSMYLSDGVEWLNVAGPGSGGGGSGIQFGGSSPTYGADNSGEYLNVTTTGTDPDSDDGVNFTDTGGGGQNFFNTGFGSNGAGTYIEGDDASASGFPVALGVQMNETSDAFPTALSLDSNTSGAGDSTGIYGTAEAVDGTSVGGQFGGNHNSGSGNSVGVVGTGNVATTGTGNAIGGQFDGQVQKNNGDATGVLATAETHVGGGSGTATGVDSSANTSETTGDAIAAALSATAGSGTAYAIKVANGYCYLNLPTSAGPTGTLYSNLGVVTVA